MRDCAPWWRHGGSAVAGRDAALVAVGAVAAPASAAAPAGGDADARTPPGYASLDWTGSVGGRQRDAEIRQRRGLLRRRQPPRAGRGLRCLRARRRRPDAFYKDHIGAVAVNVGGFGILDLDLYVYRRNADGTRGAFVAGDGQFLGTERERRDRQGLRLLPRRGHAVCDRRSAELQGERQLRQRAGPGPREGRGGSAEGPAELPRLARRVHVALRADDRDGPVGPRPPHGRLEDVREQRQVPLQDRDLRVPRRRPHVGGPGSASRLLPEAGRVRPAERGRLPHRLGRLAGIRRRGQRVRERARRSRGHRGVAGLQHDRARQAPGTAMEPADDAARQPLHGSDGAPAARRQELDRRRQPHRRQRRPRTAPATARSARCTSAGTWTARCRR